LFGLAEIFADCGKKGRGLCIFCRKNSFQGLEAINLGLISKYWIMHFLGELRKIFEPF